MEPKLKNPIKIGILLFLLCYCVSGYSQNKLEYQVDSERSSINFEISHLTFLTVKGKFKKISGTITTNSGSIEFIHAEIEVNSIFTNDKTRDESLLGKAYLHAEKYPKIIFTSVKINRKKGILYGVLKIKNVERKIEIPFTTSFVKNKHEIIITINTTLERKAFNLNFGTMDSLIGNRIHCQLKIQGSLLEN